MGNSSGKNKSIHFSKQFQKRNQKLSATKLPLEASQAVYKWCWLSSMMSSCIFYIQSISYIFVLGIRYIHIYIYIYSIYYSWVDKIKLSCYTLLQVSWDSNLQAYTMFIYLKRQIKLTFSTIIQDKLYVWINIACSVNLFIKLIQMSTIVNKFRFFIQEIFIINKFDNPQLFYKAELTNNWTGIFTHLLMLLSIWWRNWCYCVLIAWSI